MTDAQKQARIEELEAELAHKRFQIAILNRLKEVLEEMRRGEGADTRFGCLIGASDGSGSEPSLARER